MPKIYLVAQLPAEDIADFMRVVRQWERQHQHVQMAVKVDDKNDEVEDAEALMKSLMPELDFKHFYKADLNTMTRDPTSAMSYGPGHVDLDLTKGKK